MAKKQSAETSATKNTEVVDVIYTASELAEAAEAVFQTSPDVVSAALKMKGLAKVGLKEAEAIVTAYAKKEVQ